MTDKDKPSALESEIHPLHKLKLMHPAQTFGLCSGYFASQGASQGRSSG